MRVSSWPSLMPVWWFEAHETVCFSPVVLEIPRRRGATRMLTEINSLMRHVSLMAKEDARAAAGYSMSDYLAR